MLSVLLNRATASKAHSVVMKMSDNTYEVTNCTSGNFDFGEKLGRIWKFSVSNISLTVDCNFKTVLETDPGNEWCRSKFQYYFNSVMVNDNISASMTTGM